MGDDRLLTYFRWQQFATVVRITANIAPRAGALGDMRQALGDAILHDLLHEWVNTQRSGDDVSHIWISFGGFVEQSWDILSPMPTGCEKVRMSDDQTRTVFNDTAECCGNRRFG